MEPTTILLMLALVFGLYMAWGIGANDVANAMATSVGSRAITVKQAILIAAVFEFLGAFLAGGEVTATIRKGIIDADLISDPDTLLFGMLAALLAAAVWLTVASRFGWPVSTTHSIIGAIVGFALFTVGLEAVYVGKVGSIVASWVVSPVMAGMLSFLLVVEERHHHAFGVVGGEMLDVLETHEHTVAARRRRAPSRRIHHQGGATGATVPGLCPALRREACD